MKKKTYSKPSAEVTDIDFENVIAVTSDIPGGGTGEPSAKTFYQIEDDTFNENENENENENGNENENENGNGNENENENENEKTATVPGGSPPVFPPQKGFATFVFP